MVYLMGIGGGEVKGEKHRDSYKGCLLLYVEIQVTLWVVGS